MAKVTAENFAPVHARTGRAVIDWNTKKLADAAGVSLSLVLKFESGRGASSKARQAMIDALTGAGVELLNGKRHGARLARPTD